MHLITSLFLLAFSIIYLGKDSKNKTVKDITKYLEQRKESIGYWGFLYGIIASIFSLLMSFAIFLGGFLIIGMFLGNVLLVILAAPFAYPAMKKKIKAKNSKIDTYMQKIIKITDEYGVILAGFAGILSVISIISAFFRF